MGGLIRLGLAENAVHSVQWCSLVVCDDDDVERASVVVCFDKQSSSPASKQADSRLEQILKWAILRQTRRNLFDVIMPEWPDRRIVCVTRLTR